MFSHVNSTTMSELIDAAELVVRWHLENMSESEELR